MATPDAGTGATITFAVGPFTAPIMTLGIEGLSREKIDTSTLALVGAKTFIASDVHDPGEIPITFQFKADEFPPIDKAIGLVTITFADSTFWKGQGFMTNYTGVNIDHELMEGSATIKMSGAWANS